MQEHHHHTCHLQYTRVRRFGRRGLSSRYMSCSVSYPSYPPVSIFIWFMILPFMSVCSSKTRGWRTSTPDNSDESILLHKLNTIPHFSFAFSFFWSFNRLDNTISYKCLSACLLGSQIDHIIFQHYDVIQTNIGTRLVLGADLLCPLFSVLMPLVLASRVDLTYVNPPHQRRIA